MAFLKDDTGFLKAVFPASAIVFSSMFIAQQLTGLSADEFASEYFGLETYDTEVVHTRVIDTEVIHVNNEVVIPAFVKMAVPLTAFIAGLIWSLPRVINAARKSAN
jgi:hypothetical protein